MNPKTFFKDIMMLKIVSIILDIQSHRNPLLFHFHSPHHTHMS